MKALIAILAILLTLTTYLLLDVEKRLADCQFECNHLQTKLDRYEELNDIVPILHQTLPPLALAELKAVNEMILQKKHRKYEAVEQALIIK